MFLSISYFQMSDFLSSLISWAQISLAIVFAVEMVIKLTGLGPSGYAQDSWNILDFVIVLASIGALIGFAITGNNNGLIVNVIRVLRVFRLVRLLKGVSSIQKLIDTIILTIPGVINISILIFLFLFIFSVICMQLYAKTMYNGSYFENANFRNFGISFVTLFRMLTGKINDIYYLNPIINNIKGTIGVNSCTISLSTIPTASKTLLTIRHIVDLTISPDAFP